jgi:hypothetical protein
MSKHLVIHAGFHKSGTTALQTSLFDQRRHLLENGILYPACESTGHHRAAWSLTRRAWGWTGRGGTTTPPSVWSRLARSVRQHSGISVISSEFLTDCDAPAMRQLLKDTAAARNSVFFTLRPLVKILPSSYQQSLKSGRKLDYGSWLQCVLDPARSTSTARGFWHRHDHARILAAWIGIFGPENVVLAITDESAPEKIYQAFLRVLEAPESVLPASRPRRLNRSLTWPEIEFLLEVNRCFPETKRWQDYVTFVRNGAIRGLTNRPPPQPGDSPLLTPPWAIQRATEIMREENEQLRGLGLRVLGDLDAMMTAEVPAGENIPTGSVSTASAARALLSITQRRVLAHAPLGSLLAELRRRGREVFTGFTREGSR